jgi:hypothetical protein
VVNEAFARDARSVPISHSLGTIIGYNVLMNRAERSNITTLIGGLVRIALNRLQRSAEAAYYPRKRRLIA